MASSPAVPSGTSGRIGRRLLLALTLALAACGGDGDDPSSDAPEAGGQAATAAAAAPPDDCPQPPSIDDAVLHGPYSGVTQWLSANNVTFTDTNTDSTTSSVQLCRGCTPVTLKIVSEARTYCMRKDSLAGKTRIAGVYVVELGSVSPPGWGRTFNPGDSMLVFVRDTFNSAKLVYPIATSTADTVGSSPPQAWAFRYCDDGNPGRNPQGKWRKIPPGQSAAQTTTSGERESYGWMACASGCCQFYVPPPPPGLQLPDVVPDWVTPPAYGKPPCTPHGP